MRQTTPKFRRRQVLVTAGSAAAVLPAPFGASAQQPAEMLAMKVPRALLVRAERVIE